MYDRFKDYYSYVFLYSLEKVVWPSMIDEGDQKDDI